MWTTTLPLCHPTLHYCTENDHDTCLLCPRHVGLRCDSNHSLLLRTAFLLAPPLCRLPCGRASSTDQLPDMRLSFVPLCAAAVLLFAVSCPAVCADYVLSSLQSTAYGWEGTLKLSTAAPFGSDIASLALSVWFETDERLRVTLRDANAARWEIPAEILHIESQQPPASSPTSPLYDFNYISQPFGFAVSRRSTGAVLFNTSGQPLFYSSQYLQVATALPANANLYGLGERIVPFKLPQNDYTIWDTDWGNPTVLPLYGHHPLYHRIEESGDAHAVVLWNSNMVRGSRHSRHTHGHCHPADLLPACRVVLVCCIDGHQPDLVRADLQDYWRHPRLLLPAGS